jgi:DNA uptake protein ComE-like DNA-binding protein
MTTKATDDAAGLLRETVEMLESPKGSVAAAVRMLRRAAMLLREDEIRRWCEIQLGNAIYTAPLLNLLNKFEASSANKKNGEASEALEDAYAQVAAAGINLGKDITQEELSLKYSESGGRFANIGFIEERYADLVRTKKGNDGTYYKHNLTATLNYVRRVAHARAARLYNRLAYADTPQTSFDVLKHAVDDKLLDVAPDLAEHLMLAFRSVTTDSAESWSQALTTCRRFIEGLANHVMKPSAESRNGRSLGEKQPINRLWAFLDSSIESEVGRELAKRHVDFLGAYLEKTYKLTNKGVHASVSRLEAVKAVFHVYLIAADLLEYVGASQCVSGVKVNVYTSTIDELESVLGVSRTIAKSIVRVRAESGVVTLDMIGKIRGVGPRTLKRAKEVLSFNPKST